MTEYLKIDIRKVLILALSLTLLSGLLLRMRLGVLLGGFAGGLDLHRAHSHLGYYGVLFPITWAALRFRGGWVPGKKSLFWYFAFCFLSFVGFLREGYGFLAIASSTGILFFWILFAGKNIFRRKTAADGWLAAVPYAVLISSALIPFVAVLTPKDPATAKALANLFLALLMFGVFIPAVLTPRLVRRPSAWLWLPLSLAAAADTSGFEIGRFTGWGCIVWGAGFSWFLFSTLRISARRRDPILLAWTTVAVSTILLGLGLFPRSHAASVAGIHFIVLGPVLLGFFENGWRWKLSRSFQIPYFGFLIAMAAAILGTGIAPSWMLFFHRIAGATGAILIFLLAKEAWKHRHFGA